MTCLFARLLGLFPRRFPLHILGLALIAPFLTPLLTAFLPADVARAESPTPDAPATPATAAASSPSAEPATTTATTAPADLFNPKLHMRVSEVRPGMKGYGLSVFKGTKIDRFDVEVLSVLHDFNPQYDVILVSCKGANLEHTGSIAGMSGSPIFLHDDQGRDRMVGAFAYGWPLMKDPVGGVQPIEYMLRIREHAAGDNANTQPATTQSAGKQSDSSEAAMTQTASASESSATPKSNGPHWDLSDVVLLPGMKEAPPTYPLASINSFAPNPRMSVDDENVTRLRPLSTPLMTAGLPPRLVEQFTPLFKAYGMVPLQAGGGGSSSQRVDAKLERGSVLAVPLLTGDMEMTAVGTCTEVIGDRVWGFGHPFNNEGPISLPVGAGEINGVIANLMTSFKLGALGKTWGTLFADEQVGVAGKIGPAPQMIPIDLDVRYTDGSGSKKYSFQAVSHPRFTPLICAAALSGAVTGVHDLPEYQTLDYNATIEFVNGQKIQLANSLVNISMPELFFEFGTPMIAAASNPFEQVKVKRVSGVVNITPKARDATILWVNAPRLKFRPGETLKASITYRPFRASDAVLPIEFELPRDLPEGTYQFTVSGWEQFLSDERTAKPFRFAAESTDDVFAVLRELAAIRHNAVYLRLVRQGDGVAIGRTAMPNLPSSRREVLMGAGRSNMTAFVNSTTKIVPTESLMSGAAEFEVTIDKNAHVETGIGRVPRHEPTPAAPPARIEPRPAPVAPAPPDKSAPEPPQP